MAATDGIEGQVRGFLTERFPMARRRRIEADEDILDSGVVDSLGILEIVTFLEQAFAVRIEDDDLTADNFGSVRRIAGLVGRKLQPPSPAPGGE